jgi:hypothetical protein
MTVIKGTGFYHVEAANTNRQVFYNIVATPAAANLFGFLKGTNAFHPFIGQNNAPTTNQLIAQYRADYIVRYLTQWAIPVYVALAQTTDANDTLVLAFETYVSNVFGVGVGHTSGVGDIVDQLGMADRSAKTKDGLQTLATDLLALASLDGGSTLLYAANPNLSDGTASTAPAITALTVTMMTPSMYTTTP